jgi:hypothetical protein
MAPSFLASAINFSGGVASTAPLHSTAKTIANNPIVIALIRLIGHLLFVLAQA